MISSVKAFVVADILSEDLSSRDSVADLFKLFAESSHKVIEVDFSRVRSITRSFAHEFLTRKRESLLAISETQVPANVRRMLDLVNDQKVKRKIVDLDTLRIESL